MPIWDSIALWWPDLDVMHWHDNLQCLKLVPKLFRRSSLVCSCAHSKALFLPRETVASAQGRTTDDGKSKGKCQHLAGIKPLITPLNHKASSFTELQLMSHCLVRDEIPSLQSYFTNNNGHFKASWSNLILQAKDLEPDQSVQVQPDHHLHDTPPRWSWNSLRLHRHHPSGSLWRIPAAQFISSYKSHLTDYIWTPIQPLITRNGL